MGRWRRSDAHPRVPRCKPSVPHVRLTLSSAISAAGKLKPARLEKGKLYYGDKVFEVGDSVLVRSELSEAEIRGRIANTQNHEVGARGSPRDDGIRLLVGRSPGGTYALSTHVHTYTFHTRARTATTSSCTGVIRHCCALRIARANAGYLVSTTTPPLPLPPPPHTHPCSKSSFGCMTTTRCGS